ncbi:MAG: divalent-cation tolerance protein CutA [candidate division Zixibacteria bacterium]|nr:divalent-cation tolerance protein CutA [candidate division Zixibacteria bacterium]
MEDVRVVLVSIPRDESRKMARLLVENRLAACVNIVPKIDSYFWWDNAVQTEEEALLIIKTTAARFGQLRSFVEEHHPYDLPEIIALPLVDGFSEYIAWVHAETGKE